MKKRNYGIVISLLVSIIFISLGTYIYALEGKLTEDGVNFRSKPEIEKDNIMDSFNKGDIVEVLSVDGDWYKVKDKKGRTGYTSGKYIEEISNEESKEKPKTNEAKNVEETKPKNEPNKKPNKETNKEKKNAIKLKKDIEIYTLPIYYANKASDVKKDEEVEVLDKIGIWTKVRSEIGVEGWVLQSELN